MWISLILFYTLILTVLYLSYKKMKNIKISRRGLSICFYTHQLNIGQHHNKQKTINNVPGPIALPLVGTKWIFYCKYKMNKLHEVYKGNV